MQYLHLLMASAVMLPVLATMQAHASGFTFAQEIIPAELTNDTRFPYHIDIDGEFAVGGAKWHDVGDKTDAGAVVVLKLGEDGLWARDALLTDPDVIAKSELGISVEIEGEFIAAGAPYCSNDLRRDDTEGGCPPVGDNTTSADPGRVVIFRRSGDSWLHHQTLYGEVGGDAFGWTLDLDERTLVVTAPFADAAGVDSGAAYVYRRSFISDQFEHVATLVPSDLGPGDNLGYGYAVSLEGKHLALGAFHHDGVIDGEPVENTGAVWTYVRRFVQAGRGMQWQESWEETGKLIASDAKARADFGHSVAISDRRMVVGSPGYLIDKPAPTGRAYVYRREANGSWQEEAVLEHPEGDIGPVNVFGVSTHIDRGTILVNAPAQFYSVETGGDCSAGSCFPLVGATYVFRRDRGAWRSSGRAGSWQADDKVLPPQVLWNDIIHESTLNRDWLMQGALGSGIDNPFGERGRWLIYKRGPAPEVCFDEDQGPLVYELDLTYACTTAQIPTSVAGVNMASENCFGAGEEFGLDRLVDLSYASFDPASSSLTFDSDPGVFGLAGFETGSFILFGEGPNTLTGTVSGVAQFDLANGTALASGEFSIDGGTGAFAGASGTLSLEQPGVLPPDPRAPIPTTAFITGSIEVPGPVVACRPPADRGHPPPWASGGNAPGWAQGAE